MQLAVDFYRDWIELLRAELLARGFNLDPNLTDQQISYRFFHYIKRAVDPRPRRVHQAKNFQCSAELRAGLAMLVDKVAKGIDVGPHLSRRLKDINDTDLMLADWGIHHFHLGEAVASDGYVTRTGPLLFARVTADDFYMIDVRGHGAWSRQELIHAIHQCWPESIARYRLAVTAIHPALSDEDLLALRRGGVQTALSMPDGAVYMALGGGISTAKTSGHATMMGDYYAAYVRRLETHVRNNLQLHGQFEELLGPQATAVVRLKCERLGSFFATVENTNLKVVFPSER